MEKQVLTYFVPFQGGGHKSTKFCFPILFSLYRRCYSQTLLVRIHFGQFGRFIKCNLYTKCILLKLRTTWNYIWNFFEKPFPHTPKHTLNKYICRNFFWCDISRFLWYIEVSAGTVCFNLIRLLPITYSTSGSDTPWTTYVNV